MFDHSNAVVSTLKFHHIASSLRVFRQWDVLSWKISTCDRIIFFQCMWGARYQQAKSGVMFMVFTFGSLKSIFDFWYTKLGDVLELNFKFFFWWKCKKKALSFAWKDFFEEIQKNSSFLRENKWNLTYINF